jgi:ABC-2 type transport system permease protein
MNAPVRHATSGFTSRLRALTVKEFRQLWRDRGNWVSGLALPAVLIVLFGYGISLDIKSVPVAVVREDRSPTVVDVLAGLQLSPYIAPKFAESMKDAQALMASRSVDAIVRLPSNFSANLSAGHAAVQVIVHGVDAATARTIQGYIAGALGQWSVHAADRGPRGDAGGESVAVGSVRVEEQLWFNAANTSTWYLVPGLIVIIMTFLGAFLTSLVVAREWERGTLEALFVTPVRPFEIIVAKLIPYFLLGMLGFTMCMLAGRFLFGVPVVGSLIVLILSSCLYMLVSLGLGLLVSSVTKNQFLASQAALLLSFLPAVFLSGFLFDLHNVPAVVRVIGKSLPATHFLDLIKTLLLAGDVWPLILRECAILALYAAVLITAAVLVTRKRIA